MCWISDAERRWAHDWSPSFDALIECVESLMPKGVEHKLIKLNRGKWDECWISDAERRWAHKDVLIRALQPSVLNLWCRKALSTKKTHGQDAKKFLVLNLWCRKALSTVKTDIITGLTHCVESLMPKGVEHHIPLWITDREKMCWISDAERRWAHWFTLQRDFTFWCWISDAERRWALVIHCLHH